MYVLKVKEFIFKKDIELKRKSKKEALLLQKKFDEFGFKTIVYKVSKTKIN